MNKEKVKTILALETEQGLFSFGAITKKIALKKSRISGEKTPERYKAIFKIALMTVSLGNSYQKAVNNRLEKEGKVKSFKSEGTYTEPVKGSRILLKHKEKDQYYIRVYPTLCHSFHTVVAYFDNNGVEISNFKEIAEEFFPLPGKNKKQGLNDPVEPRNYRLENVKWLKRGNFKIQEIPYDAMKKMVG